MERPVAGAAKLVLPIRSVVERRRLGDVDEHGDPEAAGFVPERVEARVVDEVGALAVSDESLALVGQLSQGDGPGRDVGADGLAQALAVVGRLDAFLLHPGAHEEAARMGAGVTGRERRNFAPVSPVRMSD